MINLTLPISEGIGNIHSVNRICTTCRHPEKIKLESSLYFIPKQTSNVSKV